jgi:hypothetical protein
MVSGGVMKRYIGHAVVLILLLSALPAIAKDFFDPGGYYFPEKEINIAGYKFDSFSLVTLSYANNGKLDYQHPKVIEPIATLYLVRTKDNKKFVYRFPKPIIEKNNVNLTSVKTPIGIVKINGKFLDVRGMFWDSDIIPFQTPVFEGAVLVIRDGTQVYEKVSRFTYWGGD